MQVALLAQALVSGGPIMPAQYNEHNVGPHLHRSNARMQRAPPGCLSGRPGYRTQERVSRLQLPAVEHLAPAQEPQAPAPLGGLTSHRSLGRRQRLV